MEKKTNKLYEKVTKTIVKKSEYKPKRGPLSRLMTEEEKQTAVHRWFMLKD